MNCIAVLNSEIIAVKWFTRWYCWKMAAVDLRSIKQIRCHVKWTVSYYGFVSLRFIVFACILWCVTVKIWKLQVQAIYHSALFFVLPVLYMTACHHLLSLFFNSIFTHQHFIHLRHTEPFVDPQCISLSSELSLLRCQHIPVSAVLFILASSIKRLSQWTLRKLLSYWIFKYIGKFRIIWVFYPHQPMNRRTGKHRSHRFYSFIQPFYHSWVSFNLFINLKHILGEYRNIGAFLKYLWRFLCIIIVILVCNGLIKSTHCGIRHYPIFGRNGSRVQSILKAFFYL